MTGHKLPLSIKWKRCGNSVRLNITAQNVKQYNCCMSLY